MKNKTILAVAVFAVIILGALGFRLLADQSATRTSNSTAAPGMETATSSTLDQLSGDAYDEEFIAQMLAHHEGAVNMSEQAMAVTARPEIRQLADSIVQSQSKELISMRQWQKDWGYEITNSGGHMSHGGGGMDMAGDMTEMMGKLQGLTGDQFDREFLKQMIIHHQQAVDMVAGTQTRAKHAEIKQLARDIKTAQEAEIDQMKRWQQEWGY